MMTYKTMIQLVLLPQLLACSVMTIAEEKSPVSVVIDEVLGNFLAAKGITPANSIGDDEFVRRVTLDLAGRIPTPKELREFLADAKPDKREQLVDQHLQSVDYTFHTRNELDIHLLASLQWNNDWRAYLLEATRENRGWDRLFREILLPEKLRPEDKGAAAFLKQRVKDLDAMTNDTSTLLFGVNIACAKCHDHPLVSDWHQDHYFGFAKFFKRTFATKRGSIAERFDGEVKFTTTSGVEKEAAFMFLNGESIVEPSSPRSDEEWKAIREKLKQAELNDKADPPPIPSFSPREQLVSLALDDEGSFQMARNLANRLWARLMGRGLIHPLDQMHSENPASHPEILERLAIELVEQAYDMRPLVRGIVLSEAYARGLALEDASQTPLPEWFAVQLPRPLTPFQYSLSLQLASRSPDSLPGFDKPIDWPKIREQWEQQTESFAKSFEIPEEHFQLSVEEALLMSNSPQIENAFLQNQQETLVGYLHSLDNSQSVVDLAFLNVLGRTPDTDERETAGDYLMSRNDRSSQALQQLLWALLTSSEFRFNH